MVRPTVSKGARLFTAAALLLAFGCFRAEPLEERAAKYWKARQERDAATSYRYEHPQTRGPEGEYVTRMSSGPLVIAAAKVEKVEEEGDAAKVTVRLTYRHALVPRDISAPITDLWERVDGSWYHKTPPSEFIAGGGIGATRLRPTPAAKP